MESGIQNTAQEIPLTLGIRYASFTDKNQESITWNSESMVWNPESKAVLDSLTWDDRTTAIPWRNFDSGVKKAY